MRTFGTSVVRNLDAVLAIVMSAAAATLGVFGGSQGFLLSAIAGVLGLLAYGFIRDRSAREELLGCVHDLQRRPAAADVLKDRHAFGAFPDAVATAQHVCLVGPSLVNIFSQWAGYLLSTKLNEHGAQIDALVLDPTSPALESIAQCLLEPPDGLRKDIDVTLQRVKGMVGGEYGGGVTKGLLNLRLLRSYPNYSMVVIDGDKANGRIVVEFIGYQSRLHARPHVELTRERDRVWFDHYLAEYRALWRDAVPHASSDTGH